MFSPSMSRLALVAGPSAVVFASFAEDGETPVLPSAVHLVSQFDSPVYAN